MIKLLLIVFFIGTTVNTVTSQSAYVPNIFKFNFPWVRSSSYISFLLFTRENIDDFETLKPYNVSSSRFFKKDLPTKIIVHGFRQSAQEQIYLRIKDAYLKDEEFNIVIVDWELARRFSYSVAAAASEFVAKEIALFLWNSAVAIENVHLIGFSLGAHVVGMVGRELKGEIGRITGLDPAHPFFRFVDKRFKLDESDAKFVDVIHTDGGDSFWEANHMGIATPLGHADFYPNKGIYQPGCSKSVILNPEDIECSHLRVLNFFAESIENKGSFMACKCNSWKEFENGRCRCDEESKLASMGETCAEKSQGKYYLKTNAQFPYGLGRVGVLGTFSKKSLNEISK